jgi:hypothetical protein
VTVGLLLDFPWPLAAIVAWESEPSDVITRFIELCEKVSVRPLRFFTDEERIEFEVAVNGLRAGKGRYAPVLRFLASAQRTPTHSCRALPRDGPGDLRGIWQHVLFEEIRSSNDWRTPQIVFADCCKERWPDDELVAIDCLPCGSSDATGPHDRVLVPLEDYDAHPHARSDLDPWNLRHIHRGRGKVTGFPRVLPKPPECASLHPHDLQATLSSYRGAACRRNGRYYFVPPANWRPEVVSPEEWRKGEAFPWVRALAQGKKSKPKLGHKKGYRDSERRVWVWDPLHRHWDVQFGGRDRHLPVTHEGRYDEARLRNLLR